MQSLSHEEFELAETICKIQCTLLLLLIHLSPEKAMSNKERFHREGLFCSGDVKEVSLLIGQDLPQAHVVLDYCWGDNPINQPYAMKTPLRWCVAGPTDKEKDDSKPIALLVFSLDLHQQVERVWASESYGFGNAGDSLDSFEEKRVKLSL